MFVSVCPVLCIQKHLSFGRSEGARALADGVLQEVSKESGREIWEAGGQLPGFSAAQGWLSLT